MCLSNLKRECIPKPGSIGRESPVPYSIGSQQGVPAHKGASASSVGGRVTYFEKCLAVSIKENDHIALANFIHDPLADHKMDKFVIRPPQK